MTQSGEPVFEQADLEAFAWVMTAAAIVVSTGRYVIRYAIRKRFGWEDLSHLLALVTMIGTIACYQAFLPNVYYFIQVERELVRPPSQRELLELYIRDWKLQYTTTVLWLATTWLVKLSFLLFYRDLFRVDRNFMRAWWAVLTVIFLTWWTCIAGTVWVMNCGSLKDSLKFFQKCTSSEKKHINKVVYLYICVVTVLTDVMIITLPMWMLKKIRVSWAQKLGLAITFSLGLIIVALDVVRTIISVCKTDVSVASVCDVVVVCMAIIVSSLPAYRALLDQDNRRKTIQYLKL